MRRMKLFETVLAAVAAVAIMAPTISSANLLGNPSFEIEDPNQPNTDGLVGSVAAGDWVQFRGGGGQAIRENTMPLTGDWDLLMSTLDDATGWAGAYQEIAVTAGQSYTFGIWAKVDDMADGTPGVDFDDATKEARIRIEWHNTPIGGGSSKISGDEINITLSLTNTYQYFEVTGIAPATALKARPAVALNNNNDYFYFDDASFVPEPASLALLALGVPAVLRRRR